MTFKIYIFVTFNVLAIAHNVPEALGRLINYIKIAIGIWSLLAPIVTMPNPISTLDCRITVVWLV